MARLATRSNAFAPLHPSPNSCDLVVIESYAALTVRLNALGVQCIHYTISTTTFALGRSGSLTIVKRLLIRSAQTARSPSARGLPRAVFQLRRDHASGRLKLLAPIVFREINPQEQVFVSSLPKFILWRYFFDKHPPQIGGRIQKPHSTAHSP